VKWILLLISGTSNLFLLWSNVIQVWSKCERSGWCPICHLCRNYWKYNFRVFPTTALIQKPPLCTWFSGGVCFSIVRLFFKCRIGGQTGGTMLYRFCVFFLLPKAAGYRCVDYCVVFICVSLNHIVIFMLVYFQTASEKTLLSLL
jgi:hypothetical protein